MTTILAAIACAIAVTASYFNTSMGLALLALPSLGVAIPALAALKTARWEHVPELSPQANALLKKYGHFYSMPFGSADFASAANVVCVSAVLIGLWGLARGAYWNLLLALACAVAMRTVGARLRPTGVLRRPGNRAAHEEVTNWIVARLGTAPDSQAEESSSFPAGVEPSPSPEVGAAHLWTKWSCSTCRHSWVSHHPYSNRCPECRSDRITRVAAGSSDN